MGTESLAAVESADLARDDRAPNSPSARSTVSLGGDSDYDHTEYTRFCLGALGALDEAELPDVDDDDEADEDYYYGLDSEFLRAERGETEDEDTEEFSEPKITLKELEDLRREASPHRVVAKRRAAVAAQDAMSPLKFARVARSPHDLLGAGEDDVAEPAAAAAAGGSGGGRGRPGPRRLLEPPLPCAGPREEGLGLAVVDCVVTDVQQERVRQQLKQHAQLTTQIFVLASQHDSFREVAAKCRSQLEQLAYLQDATTAYRYVVERAEEALCGRPRCTLRWPLSQPASQPVAAEVGISPAGFPPPVISVPLLQCVGALWGSPLSLEESLKQLSGKGRKASGAGNDPTHLSTVVESAVSILRPQLSDDRLVPSSWLLSEVRSKRLLPTKSGRTGAQGVKHMYTQGLGARSVGRNSFSAEEDALLELGLHHYGLQWHRIHDAMLPTQLPEAIEVRYAYLTTRQSKGNRIKDFKLQQTAMLTPADEERLLAAVASARSQGYGTDANDSLLWKMIATHVLPSKDPSHLRNWWRSIATRDPVGPRRGKGSSKRRQGQAKHRHEGAVMLDGSKDEANYSGASMGEEGVPIGDEDEEDNDHDVDADGYGVEEDDEDDGDYEEGDGEEEEEEEEDEEEEQEEGEEVEVEEQQEGEQEEQQQNMQEEVVEEDEDLDLDLDDDDAGEEDEKEDAKVAEEADSGSKVVPAAAGVAAQTGVVGNERRGGCNDAMRGESDEADQSSSPRQSCREGLPLCSGGGGGTGADTLVRHRPVPSASVGPAGGSRPALHPWNSIIDGDDSPAAPTPAGGEPTEARPSAVAVYRAAVVSESEQHQGLAAAADTAHDEDAPQPAPNEAGRSAAASCSQAGAGARATSTDCVLVKPTLRQAKGATLKRSDGEPPPSASTICLPPHQALAGRHRGNAAATGSTHVELVPALNRYTLPNAKSNVDKGSAASDDIGKDQTPTRADARKTADVKSEVVIKFIREEDFAILQRTLRCGEQAAMDTADSSIWRELVDSGAFGEEKTPAILHQRWKDLSKLMN